MDKRQEEDPEEQMDRAVHRPSPWLGVRVLRRAYARFRFWLIQLKNPGLTVGRGPLIVFSRVRFDTWPGPITIGDYCGLYGGDIEGTVVLGDRVNLVCPCRVGGSSKYKVTIGSDTWVAPNAYIVPTTHAYKRRDLTISEQGVYGADITIGEDCWIGINVVISPGVTIGKGAVIGANSVVTRDIPEYAIAVGAPAKMIGSRE
jgi:acetyltransferase-like isoleucine patch superfamily enzyme